ncbi:MAG: hypothetical protein LBT27_01105, partial [Prevotellaceae bacterium]|nr:hypothetical protein [Prevotellaceae bacterium]
MKYSNIREEEIKNSVATDFFGQFDCDKIVGFIDFAVKLKRPKNTIDFDDEYLLWAEENKKGANIEKWKRCKIIGKKITAKLSKDFPEGIVEHDIKNLKKIGVKFFGISLEYEGLSVSITVQDNRRYDEPFIYMDSIQTQGESRGKGLCVKVLDDFKFLVEEGVFQHLNVKDMSGGFWAKMMKKYDFIQERFT